jgi:hypothetical protein
MFQNVQTPPPLAPYIPLSTDVVLKIEVTDMNDQSPVFKGVEAAGYYTVSLPENTASATAILSVTATDADKEAPNNVVSTHTHSYTHYKGDLKDS